MPSGKYRLIMRQGPVPGRTFDLSKDVIVLGRDVKNDLVVNDAEVSRHHTRLTATPAGYQVEDLVSTNGTFVNGQRITAATPLRPGDLVGMGDTVVLEFGLVAQVDATVMAGSGSPPMDPEMARPVAPKAAASVPPPPPYLPPPAEPAKNNTMLYVGIGCGVLAICGCLGGAALLASYFMSSGQAPF